MLAVWAPSAWHGWLHPLAKQSLHRLIPPACVFFFVPGEEGGGYLHVRPIDITVMLELCLKPIRLLHRFCTDCRDHSTSSVC